MRTIAYVTLILALTLTTATAWADRPTYESILTDLDQALRRDLDRFKDDPVNLRLALEGSREGFDEMLRLAELGKPKTIWDIHLDTFHRLDAARTKFTLDNEGQAQRIYLESIRRAFDLSVQKASDRNKPVQGQQWFLKHLQVLERAKTLFHNHPRHLTMALRVADRMFTIRESDWTFQGKNIQRMFAENLQTIDTKFPIATDKETRKVNWRYNNIAKASARRLMRQGYRWQVDETLRLERKRRQQLRKEREKARETKKKLDEERKKGTENPK